MDVRSFDHGASGKLGGRAAALRGRPRCRPSSWVRVCSTQACGDARQRCRYGYGLRDAATAESYHGLAVLARRDRGCASKGRGSCHAAPFGAPGAPALGQERCGRGQRTGTRDREGERISRPGGIGSAQMEDDRPANSRSHGRGIRALTGGGCPGAPQLVVTARVYSVVLLWPAVVYTRM